MEGGLDTVSNRSSKIKALILLWPLIVTLSCNLLPASPAPANNISVTAIATEAELPVSPSSASPAPPTLSPLPPSPAPRPTAAEPAIIAEAVSPSEFDFDDLAPHQQAMLPDFAEDVETVAAAGASRYNLEVSLDFPTANSGSQAELHLNGREQVRYTNTEDVSLSEIYFRLYPNLPGYGGQMQVETVVVDGKSVAPELEAGNSALRLPLPRPLAPGEMADVSLSFESIVPSNTRRGYNIFAYTDNTVTLAGFYPAIAVYDDKGWNVEVPPPYGDATYLDVSLYRVRLTVPEQMVVAASGSLLDTVINVDGTKTLLLVSGPMRDFYVAMRQDYQVVSETVDGTIVNSYYPPGLESGGKLALRYAAGALRVFNKDFGQYPYLEFDVVATPTTAGGVEYPGIVVISQRLYDAPGGFFQHATVHEVAHQWWYGVVGNDQVGEPWLDESLTNYSTVFYWEEAEGQDVASRIIVDLFRGPYERAKQQGHDRAVAGPVMDFSEGDYGLFVYSKGPLFFDALRQEVGDEIYTKIMQTYYSEYKYRVAQSDDLLEIIERGSNRKVDTLFETWID